MLTNSYNGWLNSVHAPNFSPIWTTAIIGFCAFIYIAFYRILTVSKDSLIYQQSVFKKSIIDWHNINYLTGQADKNGYLDEVTIHISGNPPITIQHKFVKGFSQLVRLLRERVTDDRTPNAELANANEANQRKLQRFSTILNGIEHNNYSITLNISRIKDSL